MRLLFWLCSHSAISAFISLTTHYPVSSLKTDEAILHKSEKWWKMTSSNSRAGLGIFFDLWQWQSQDLYQNWDLYFITCYAPKHKLKTKHTVIWEYIQSCTSPHSVWGFILLSGKCNQKPNEKLVVALLRKLVYIMNSARQQRTQTHILYKHIHSSSQTLKGYIYCHGIRIWNNSQTSSIWRSLHVNHKGDSEPHSDTAAHKTAWWLCTSGLWVKTAC